MTVDDFVNEAKDMTAVEVLNYYRNLYYAEPQNTERGVVANAINEVLPQMQLTQEKACRVAVGEGIEKLKADLKSLATVEEYIDYSLNPEWVATRAAAALQYIEALEAGFKKIEALAVCEELTDEEMAELTGYKCPVCQHHEICTTPNMKPLCGETYTHFEPKIK